MTKVLNSYRFDDATLEAIETIQKELGLPSATATIEKALELLAEVTKTQEAGGCVVIVTKDNERREVVFL